MAFSGVVIDALSKEKIAYATIGLIEQNTGTNTNEQGNFTIKSNIYTDTLLITHIGYEPLKIALNKIKSANNFLLKRKQVLFNGIVVKNIFIVRNKIHLNIAAVIFTHLLDTIPRLPSFLLHQKKMVC